jgi:hypothetical protein
MVQAAIADVTARVRARSQPSREKYLRRVEAIPRRGPHRGAHENRSKRHSGNQNHQKEGQGRHTGRTEQSRDCNRTNVFWHDLFVETIRFC